MSFNVVVLVAALASSPSGADSLSCVQPPLADIDSVRTCAAAADTNPRRRHAIEYSDWYARRLLVHRVGSYTMLPLFATEYVLGQKLLNGADRHSAIGAGHALAAGGIGVLFTVNTATGLWNLWDARSDPAGRTRRTIHSLAMLAGDAGFVWTGAIAGQAKHSSVAAVQHRNVALGSIGVSTLGTAMMWFWKN
jgi:hypothetical protein